MTLEIEMSLNLSFVDYGKQNRLFFLKERKKKGRKDKKIHIHVVHTFNF